MKKSNAYKLNQLTPQTINITIYRITRNSHRITWNSYRITRNSHRITWNSVTQFCSSYSEVL